MAEAQQRNVGQKAEEVATKVPEEKSMLKTFFSRARVLGVFLVGVAIGMLSLSVFAKEFSSPTSLRPSTLATTTDQFFVTAENGSAIIKTHVQATGFVKPASGTTVRRMNKTADIPVKADFAVEVKTTKPGVISKTTALFAKNSTSASKTGSTSTSTTGSGSSTTGTTSTGTGTSSTTSKATTTKAPDTRISTPVGVAALKAPLKPVNMTKVLTDNAGVLPKTVIPLSTTNPKTLTTKKPSSAATVTKKPVALQTKKPISEAATKSSSSKKATESSDKEASGEDKEEKGSSKSGGDSDKKYTIATTEEGKKEAESPKTEERKRQLRHD